MALNLIRLYETCQDKIILLKKLQLWKIIPEEGLYLCPKCGGLLSLSQDNSRLDGWRWVCYNDYKKYEKGKKEKCNTFVEFRTGTFLASSHLTTFQILGFVELWTHNVTLVMISRTLEISYAPCVDFSSFCREVLLNAFINNTEKIGGEGIIVEIDESKFGKRKYNRGHHVDGTWVFGGYERGSGKVFMIPVEFRNAETLIPIIQEWIRPGTIILSDFWKAYNCLELIGFKHLKVNHSLHFKDPDSGVHTNSIESTWRAAKAIVTSSGRKKSHIPGNLAKYMFFKKCKETKADRTVEFLKYAGQLYNPAKNEPPIPQDFSDDEDDEITFPDELDG